MKKSICYISASVSAFLLCVYVLTGNAGNGDISLDVPVVRDPGSRWSASVITMLLKYHNPSVTLDDVFRKSGNSDVISYGAVSEWAKRTHKVSMVFSENGNIDAIIRSINKKQPVMLLQRISEKDDRCTLRIASGYNPATNEIIYTDPSAGEKGYRLSYKQFIKLWEESSQSCKGWPPNPYWHAGKVNDNPDDFILDVPFEPNRGNTCASSSMAMLLRYHGAAADFNAVLEKAGLPPVIDYEAVNRWSSGRFGLSLQRINGSDISGIISHVKNGHPVMVLQQFSLNRPEGHNRVVVGYNLKTSELIINDPSELGFEYRMDFKIFEKLWDRLPNITEGWPPRPMWIVKTSSVKQRKE